MGGVNFEGIHHISPKKSQRIGEKHPPTSKGGGVGMLPPATEIKLNRSSALDFVFFLYGARMDLDLDFEGGPIIFDILT